MGFIVTVLKIIKKFIVSNYAFEDILVPIVETQSMCLTSTCLARKIIKFTGQSVKGHRHVQGLMKYYNNHDFKNKTLTTLWIFFPLELLNITHVNISELIPTM